MATEAEIAGLVGQVRREFLAGEAGLAPGEIPRAMEAFHALVESSGLVALGVPFVDDWMMRVIAEAIVRLEQASMVLSLRMFRLPALRFVHGVGMAGEVVYVFFWFEDLYGGMVTRGGKEDEGERVGRIVVMQAPDAVADA